MLDLPAAGRQVNHSWCIGVVSLDYGGLGGAVMEVAVGRHVG